jgi:hypothetical protein
MLMQWTKVGTDWKKNQHTAQKTLLKIGNKHTMMSSSSLQQNDECSCRAVLSLIRPMAAALIWSCVITVVPVHWTHERAELKISVDGSGVQLTNYCKATGWYMITSTVIMSDIVCKRCCHLLVTRYFPADVLIS